MHTLDKLKAKRNAILEIARKYGAKNVRVFGSVARNESTPESDIDILVEMEEGRSAFDLGGLLIELEELLGTRVDIVTENGLSPYIRESVLDEAVGL